MNFPSLRLCSAAALMCALALPGAASAEVVLLDRGLPTANVNEDLVTPANGANRSNVAWYDGRYTSATDYWLVGDTFKNTSSQTWFISTLRMWSFEPFTAGSAQLYGGKSGGGAYSALSTGALVTSDIKYANGDTYRDAVDSNTALYQIDFAVNIQLAAGETLEYLFDADVLIYNGPPGLHASNAARSGSAQEGADDQMLFGRLDNGSVDMASVAYWSSAPLIGPAPWDKASDFNVQVIGEAPEPASLALAALALAAAGASSRRRPR